MHLGSTIVAGLALGTMFAGQVSAQPAPERMNPLLQPSALPYGVPRFDQIRSDDFRAAFDQGMREELADVDRIAGNAEPPTFANTIEALERSGALLRRTQRVFNVLLSAHSDDALQKIDAEYAPKLAAHRDAIDLNPQLFARVKSLYDRRDSLGLDAEQLRLLEERYRSVVRAGAALSEADKEAVRANNVARANAVAELRRRMLAEVNAAAIVVDDRALLDGLPEGGHRRGGSSRECAGSDGQVGAAAAEHDAAAGARLPAQSRACASGCSRRRSRAMPSGANDTTALVQQIAQLRAERAKLLGFDDHAAYTLDDTMAKTPENALGLMRRMVPATAARTRDEAARLQARLRMDVPGATLEPWDWQYYAEQVRRADYAVDESEVRQYFELDRVLRDGVFFAATQLYGITFRERHDIPVYHPDVRVFEVFNADGSPLGLVYLDYFARPSKRGGAWMNSLEVQSGLLGHAAGRHQHRELHEAVARQPGAAHARPGRGRCSTSSGTRCTGCSRTCGIRRSPARACRAISSRCRRSSTSTGRTSRRCSRDYARHYQTGEPMPAALKERIDRARTFNGGFALAEHARRVVPRHGLAHAAGRRSCRATSTRFESCLAEVARPRHPRGAAAVPHARTSSTSGRSPIPPATTRISGARCSIPMPTRGSRRTAG